MASTTKILEADIVPYAGDMSIPVQTTDAEGAQRILAQDLVPGNATSGVTLNRTLIVGPVNVDILGLGGGTNLNHPVFRTVADSSAWKNYQEIELLVDVRTLEPAQVTDTEEPITGDNRTLRQERLSTQPIKDLAAAPASAHTGNAEYLVVLAGASPTERVQVERNVYTIGVDAGAASINHNSNSWLWPNDAAVDPTYDELEFRINWQNSSSSPDYGYVRITMDDFLALPAGALNASASNSGGMITVRGHRSGSNTTASIGRYRTPGGVDQVLIAAYAGAIHGFQMEQIRYRSVTHAYYLARDANDNLLFAAADSTADILPLRVYGIGYSITTVTPVLMGYTTWLHGVKDGVADFTDWRDDAKWLDDLYDDFAGGYPSGTSTRINRATFREAMSEHLTFSQIQLAASSGDTYSAVNNISRLMYLRGAAASRLSAYPRKFIKGPIYMSSNGANAIPGVSWNGENVARGDIDVHNGEFQYPFLTASVDFSASDLSVDDGSYDDDNIETTIAENTLGSINLLPNSVFTLSPGKWSIEVEYGRHDTDGDGGGAVNMTVLLFQEKANQDDIVIHSQPQTAFRNDGTYYVNVGGERIDVESDRDTHITRGRLTITPIFNVADSTRFYVVVQPLNISETATPYPFDWVNGNATPHINVSNPFLSGSRQFWALRNYADSLDDLTEERVANLEFFSKKLRAMVTVKRWA